MYDKLCKTQSDINENLPVLARIASECKHVTEMGVRYCVSTWAFIEGLQKGGKLVSIDIKHPSAYNGDITLVEQACRDKEIDFTFLEASTLEITLKPTDLLFIDTLHTGEQLRQELKLHANKAKKYIAFHDTVSCADELMPVINQWLAEGKWKIKEHHMNNNGLMVCEKC